MKTIKIFYFMGQKPLRFTHEHKKEFKYSMKKRNELINEILEKNYQAMLVNNGSELLIMVDNGNFRQR